MSSDRKLIARATVRAYASAIAGGADADTALETACALYRHGHPRIRESILRRVVEALVGHPPKRMQAGKQEGPHPGVIAAQNAYIRAITQGAKAHVAFDVARAAYRALCPWLAGPTLDAAVAQALASGATPPARPNGGTAAPSGVHVAQDLAAVDVTEAPGDLGETPALR